MKNLPRGVHHRSEMAEEGISGFEVWSIKTTQTKEGGKNNKEDKRKHTG